MGLLVTAAFGPAGLLGQEPAQVSSRAPQAAAATPAAISLEERADIFMARKAYADAVDYYRRALKQVGFASAVIWNKLGIAYQQQQDYRAARKAYNEALRRQKDFAIAWNNIGTTYFLENKYSKSIKFYQRSLQLNPNSAPVHLNLGTAYYHKKKYAEAVTEYGQALRLDPNVLSERSPVGSVVQTRSADAQYYFYLAKALASTGRAEDAVRYLRRALEDGFGDLKRIREDADFQKISDFPAFVELLNNPPVPIKP
jgi:tetratricopeptide (TPR) repeat protein